ncbi:MAG: methionyl-tRNA formyltransferase [Myxococcota bacterium]
MRIGYLCMQGEFSVKPLSALLRAGHDVRFVMRPLPRSFRRFPVLHRVSEDPLERQATDEACAHEPFVVAGEAGIPRYLVGDASAQEAIQLYQAEKIDLIVVAFFNQLLSIEALSVTRFGGVNAHPSLLPELRGAAPLFWTYYDGRGRSGVTVHQIAAGEDDGAVFEQFDHPVPFGSRAEDLLSTMADAAAQGVELALRQIAAGQGPRFAQDEACVSRAPRPHPADTLLQPAWGARRIFHFVRGVGRMYPLKVLLHDTAYRCIDAVAFDEGRRMPAEWGLVGDSLVLGCVDGAVTLQVTPEES